MRRVATAVAVLITVGAAAADLTLDGRLKWFSTVTALPPEDAGRQLRGTPVYDHNADLRLLFRARERGVRLVADYTVTWLGGDGFLARNPLNQSPTGDARRMMDLTDRISEGNRHLALHRLDRLAVAYRGADWGLTVGRQAVSWGSGLAFQPMDLFNPFAPTAVDRDYKPGDDLILIEKLFAGGGDLELLAVGRREPLTGKATNDVASYAAKWHGFFGASEYEVLAAKHFRDEVYGVTIRTPLGGAMLRTDVTGTRLADGEWFYSGIVNADVSFSLGGRTSYAFIEYFHNDFGVKTLPDNPAALPRSLLVRLERGELFNLMRDYTAVGMTLEWSPLWRQSLTVLTNLHDSSSLAQTTLSFEPSDHTRLELGAVAVFGRPGDEFGGVPVAPGLTAGGGARAYLRWVYFR